MQESFGARLRRRREEQSIALGTIAEQTKIKQSLLEALERDDVSHWPAGIFRRAFIRAYGHAIGLNPDDVVREFVETYPEPADVASAAAIAATLEAERSNGGPPTRLRTMVGSAFGSLSRLRRGPASEAPPIPGVSAEAVSAFVPEERVIPAPSDSLPRADRREPSPEPEVPVVSSWTPLKAPTESSPDLTALAQLCTEFGRVEHSDQVQPLLRDAARMLDASGLIVWIWDVAGERLSPALAHGYSGRVLAQLPTVHRDADNPTAAAFRTGQTCAIGGSAHASAALVLPLHTPGGCGGVLAIELQQGTALTVPVRAVATILAALLAQLLGAPRPAEVQAEAGVTEQSAPERHGVVEQSAPERHEDPPAYRPAALAH